jgi:hypothetical protein
MAADFSDIRFRDSTKNNDLFFWLEKKVDSDTATFWVKIPSLPASPAVTKIYMRYGDAALTSASDGDSVFTVFNDFSHYETYPHATKYSGNPVANGEEPSILKVGSEYWLYYDNANYVWRRTSTDRITWTAPVQILGGVLCDVTQYGSTFRMFYCRPDLKSVILATCTDGVSFVDVGTALTVGSAGEFDDFDLEDPCEIIVGDTSFLFYGGTHLGELSIGMSKLKIGAALPYVKVGQKMAKTGTGFEKSGAADAELLEYDAGKYLMIFTAFDGANQHPTYAISTDLYTWARSGLMLYWKSQTWEDALYGPNEPSALIEDGSRDLASQGENSACTCR